MRGRLALVCIVGGALTFPAAAAANHHHALTTGSGDCVVLAVGGNEPYVVLPEASFNNTTEPTMTMNPHPLHVHVHRGEAGMRLDIAVLDSAADECAEDGNYLNYDEP